MTGATLVDQYDLLIVDLDGVVYLGTQAVPGAAEALRRARAGGVGVVFATNNASRRADEVAELLTSMGVPADASEVLTSAQAAAAALAGVLPAGGTVLAVGSPSLAQELRAVGLIPVETADGAVDAVVQGFGPNVGWALLAEACVAIRSGARWVATNLDSTWPSTRGPLPGNGALVAAVATALGRQPDDVVGKPQPGLFRAAVQRGASRRPLVVGDRMDTDIAGARHAGMDSLLVLTGVTRPRDLLGAQPLWRPDFLAIDLNGLSAPADVVAIPREPIAGDWRAVVSGTRVELTGDGKPVDALRALCVAAWAVLDQSGDPPTLGGGDEAAQRALRQLELG